MPPAEGFNMLGWIMPFAGIALGLMAIFLYWKRFHPVGSRTAAAPVIDEKYRQRIEAEMADLDDHMLAARLEQTSVAARVSPVARRMPFLTSPTSVAVPLKYDAIDAVVRRALMRASLRSSPAIRSCRLMNEPMPSIQ